MRRRVLLLAFLSACSGILGFDPPLHRVDGGAGGACTGGGQCAATQYCDVVCKDKRADGSPCPAGADEQCENGHCVTEGETSICCNQECAGPCRSCLAATTSGADGQCVAIGAGLDPKNACPESECTTGACDGAGSCGNVDDRTACSELRSCCAGACVSERTDPANCGMCGRACAVSAGEICAVGTCGVVDWALWPMPAGGAGEPNPASYTDNGDGTVTDNVTHLMWQKAINVNAYTFASAKTYCANTLSNQGLAHHHDWRLPSRIELVSLVSFDVASPGPTIDSSAFPFTPTELFWSSTPFASSPSGAWIVSFGNGNSGFRDVADPYRVRCVR